MAIVADPTTATIPSPRWRIFKTGSLGFLILLVIALPCFLTLPWSISRYDLQQLDGSLALSPPTLADPMGTDLLGRSMLWRCLLGGAISLSIGISAAVVTVVIGVCWGALAGYVGDRTDALMMRAVDIIYSLPYILLVVLLDVAIQPRVESFLSGVLPGQSASSVSRVMTLLIAIGGVGWLTMARVIRGQVLSLRGQPFIEAARACGVGPVRILRCHVLPNLVGPITVYATLAVPAAILQESFLSFLGIGIQAPLPSWGNLASDGLGELHVLGQEGIVVHWWLIVWPCTLLGFTLLAMNLLGDSLRERFDPRHAA